MKYCLGMAVLLLSGCSTISTRSMYSMDLNEKVMESRGMAEASGRRGLIACIFPSPYDFLTKDSEPGLLIETPRNWSFIDLSKKAAESNGGDLLLNYAIERETFYMFPFWCSVTHRVRGLSVKLSGAN